ncbi:hypothetical protein CfE428DRAFT_0651 [Chthoniobacter flavus Ellin428]|uniref:Uncharacterized protein n=1 Tax=Chthoniobacter flavus Ellin428 TaxID=497964 RepID=B4CVG4_9BACT|nr:hypothetical protein [Chthoniobacter flavus]EDY21406.1 hypothetical protein CfE428DRAFT_0651 [Chthoniobacter flavus Ellin428]TCO95366.1 hypothetical protein EV701_10152 [Chthoniobacter flavus]
MNYIAPGLRELGRIYNRQYRRARLVRERRRLAHMESQLGLLGWQQADFGTDAQLHVDRLAGVERDQVLLTNESAALGLTLQQLEERRTAERATYETQRAERIATRDPLVPPVEESEKLLSARQKERKDAEEHLNALDREKVTNEEKYRELLAKGNHTSQQEAEVQRLRARVMLLPQETHEWHQKLMATQVEIPRVETELEQRRAMLAVETDALRMLEKNFAESDKAFADEIAKQKRDKQKLEQQINALEKSKTKPYREIGRILADHGIEPANQPEALAGVLGQRGHIAAEEAQIIESLEASRRENPVELWGSWSLLFTLLVLLWGVLWFTLLRGR